MKVFRFWDLLHPETPVKHGTHFYMLQKPPWHVPVCHFHTEIWSCNSYITYLLCGKTGLNTKHLGCSLRAARALLHSSRGFCNKSQCPLYLQGKQSNLIHWTEPTFPVFHVLTAAPMWLLSHQTGTFWRINFSSHMWIQAQMCCYVSTLCLLSRKNTTWR